MYRRAREGSGARVSDEARPQRRRLVATLLVAVLLPAAVLAYGTLQAVRSDRFVLAKLREERLSLSARALVEEVEAEARERARAVLEAAGEAGTVPLDALAQRLEAARGRMPLVKEYAVLDARGRLVLPRPRRPRIEAAPEEQLPLKDAVERFERRQALERRLAAARRLEARGADVAAARDAYREVAADPENPDVAARARLDMARASARLGEVDAALEALDVLGREGTDLRTDGGLAIAPAARLRAGELRLAAGRLEEGAARLLDLVQDILEGRAPLAEEEARFFVDRARQAVRLALPRLGAPAFAEALARLDREALRREAQAAWTRDFQARLLPDLAPVIESLREGDVRLATTGGGDAPRLVAMGGAAIEVEGAPGPLAVLAELDLAALVAEVIAPALRRDSEERGVRLAVVDRRGKEIASFPPAHLERSAEGAESRGGSDAALSIAPESASSLAPFEEILPFWRARASAAEDDPEESMARRRTLLLSGLVALLLVVLGAGAIATVRAVERSLALARLKSEFVAHVSHELRTPLTSIRMFAELLRTGRAKTPEKTKDYLERIEAESQRLQRLIDDLLDFARLEAGRKEYRFAAGDLGEIAEEAVAALGAQLLEAGFTVDLDVRRPLPKVRLDRESMRAAVENLIANARKYAGERRYVAVRVLESELASGARAVAIEVEDRGLGIGDDELPHVFERFFRGKDAAEMNVPGSGLGLALVKKVVEDHGGEVSVSSRKGEGTTFRVSLPVAG